MSNLRKPNRVLLPTNENAFSPDLLNKYNHKQYNDPTNQLPHEKYGDIQEYLPRKNKNQQYINNLTIPQINIELDKNLDQIIYLLTRRKNLMTSKKRKIIEEANEKMNKAKLNIDTNHPDLINDEEFVRITSFCQNPKTAVKMLGKIIQTIPEIKGPRIDEQERSQQFWSRNRKLQNDIDSLLEKLKYIDKQLEKENVEVLQICRELDRIEQTLKSFVGAKSPDHMQKVEPLFNSKKKNYDILNRKIKDRQMSKDKKIQYIKRIRHILEELKKTREERLEEIAQFFGVDNSWEFDQINFKEQGDFGTSLEQLFKIKERDNQLEISEKEVMNELEDLEKDQDKVYSELLKILSDQAKAFHNFNGILNQRLKYNSLLSLFHNESENLSLNRIDPREYIKKFKQVKTFFKKFLEEDTLLKQGLVKTSETTKTFVGLLRATENEKERRHELLGLLEACIKKRGEYQQKREELRSIQYQQSRNEQEHTQYLQDLQELLTEGDIDCYKKIGNAINKCQAQKSRLQQVKQVLDKQMQSMDREVLSIANRIQQQYNDILSDILPSDYEYSLKTGEDVKKLRNQLRKMYKRLGLINNQ